MFDKRKRGIKKEENETEDRVMSLLREEVKELTKKVNKQDDDIRILTEKVDMLQSENKTLKDVLQGRDDSTQQFQKDAYSAIEIIKRSEKTSDENAKLLAKIVSLLEVYTKK